MTEEMITIVLAGVDPEDYCDESEVRPGGVTIDIDAEDADVSLLGVNINDWMIHPGDGS